MQMATHNNYKTILASISVAVFLLAISGCAPKRITGFEKSDLSIDAGSRLALQVADTAQTQIGKPYNLGGATPQRGFDCSGLVYWAYAQHGVTVPRITTKQAQSGIPVARNKLIPGDIIVFRAPAAPNGLHTGIYTGGGKFVHSLNSKSRVQLGDLTNSHWDKNYLTARRVISVQANR